MNFLLHHHTALDRLGSPIAALGAMLPDLWRIADRRVRPRLDVDPAAAASAAERALFAGVAHHRAIDRWFHGSTWFREGETMARELVRRRGVRTRRMPLFAHPLWEMALDGAIVTRFGLERTLERLGESFDTTPPEALRSVEIRSCRLASAHDDGAPGRFDARMRELCDELRRPRWIGGYRDPAGLCRRLDGVRARLGLAPIEPVDRAAMEAVAGELVRAAATCLDGLLHDAQMAVP